MQYKSIIGGVVLLLFSSTLTAQHALSLNETLLLMQQQNHTLLLAKKGIEWNVAERDRLRSFWYPHINASGAYTYLANDIEVKESLSQITDPAKDFIHSIVPDEQFISSILDKIGQHSLTFGLMPNNLTTIDANMLWTLFAGGKRIHASRIGSRLVDISRIEHQQVDATLQAEVVTSYFAVRLGTQVVQVRQRAYNDLLKHYEYALKMEQNGILNKADRLFAQVTMEESKRTLTTAKKELYVAQQALNRVVNLDSTQQIEPTTALFINAKIPTASYFKAQLPTANFTVNKLAMQEKIAHNQLQIDRAAYLPNIALWAKQTMYSNGIPSNLVPRSMVGVAFTWNLFDGLEREKRIRQTKIAAQMVNLTKQKAVDDLGLAVDKFYAQLENALTDVASLQASIALGNELVRMRKRAFLEGMGTSIEVIDAEVMRANVHIASLAAYYAYDVALINLLAVCGLTDTFAQYRASGAWEAHLQE